MDNPDESFEKKRLRLNKWRRENKEKRAAQNKRARLKADKEKIQSQRSEWAKNQNDMLKVGAKQAGKEWTLSDIERLEYLISCGFSHSEIARELLRTRNSIEHKAARLHLKEKQNGHPQP